MQAGFVLKPAHIPTDLTALCKSQIVPGPPVQIVSVNLAPLTEQRLVAQAQQNHNWRGQSLTPRPRS